MELRMDSQAAVQDSSSRRSSSCGSDDAGSNMQPRCPPQTAESQQDLHFIHARHDGSPHRASRQSFENDLAIMQSSADGTVNPEEPTERIREGPVSDGVDAELAETMQDPFPDHPTSHVPLPDSTSEFPLVSSSSAPTSHPTPHPSDQQDSAPLVVASTLPSHRFSAEEPASRHIPFRSPTPPPIEPQRPSQPQPSNPLPAPLPSYDNQRASPSLHPSTTHPTDRTTPTPSQPQTNQPTSPVPTSHPSHHPPVQRNRRRRRFVHWLRRRFRRQLPWLEGWLHRREGSERREATMAIKAAEEVGL